MTAKKWYIAMYVRTNPSDSNSHIKVSGTTMGPYDDEYEAKRVCRQIDRSYGRGTTGGQYMTFSE